MPSKEEKKQYAQMIKKEITASDRNARELIKKPLVDTVNHGEVLGPVHFVDGEHNRSLWLEADSLYCRYRPGDTVQMRTTRGDTSRVAIENVTIKSVQWDIDQKLMLEVTKKRELPKKKEQDYFLFPDHNHFFNEQLIHKIRSLPSHNAEPEFLKLSKGDLHSQYSLNRSQKKAFHYIIDQGLNGSIQGPPGTGKTWVLGAIVKLAIKNHLKVGLAAYTHNALDQALSRIVKSSVSNKKSSRHLKWQRVGNLLKIDTQQYVDQDRNLLADKNCSPSFSQSSPKNQVYGATTHSWVLSPTAPKVDLLIVDEAGQVPSYMTLLLESIGTRVVWLGDHRQLAPILLAEHEEMPADAFSASLQISGNEEIMLSTQYRMNQRIQEWSSDRYYHGELKPAGSVAKRDIIDRSSITMRGLGASPVQLITHRCRARGGGNPGEASLIADLIAKLLRAGIKPDQIGIISPHRIQNSLITQKLVNKVGPKMAQHFSIDTVERFQGQEREIIIFSLATGKDGSLMNGEGIFLGDARRINVAITRSKSRFYCFAPESLLRHAARHGTKEKGSDLDDFLKWCQRQSRKRRLR